MLGFNSIFIIYCKCNSASREVNKEKVLSTNIVKYCTKYIDVKITELYYLGNQEAEELRLRPLPTRGEHEVRFRHAAGNQAVRAAPQTAEQGDRSGDGVSKLPISATSSEYRDLGRNFESVDSRRSAEVSHSSGGWSPLWQLSSPAVYPFSKTSLPASASFLEWRQLPSSCSISNIQQYKHQTKWNLWKENPK